MCLALESIPALVQKRKKEVLLETHSLVLSLLQTLGRFLHFVGLSLQKTRTSAYTHPCSREGLLPDTLEARRRNALSLEFSGILYRLVMYSSSTSRHNGCKQLPWKEWLLWMYEPRSFSSVETDLSIKYRNLPKVCSRERTGEWAAFQQDCFFFFCFVLVVPGWSWGLLHVRPSLGH